MYTIYIMKHVIERVALRDVIHRKLLERILHGELSPGSRVKDTQLSEEMAVSRTPVREALVRLVKEGFLENTVGRGFVVRPLTAREVSEIYPIISGLEALALRSSQPPAESSKKNFERIAEDMAKPHPDFIPLIELDQEWHRELLSGCSNQRLLAMINDLKWIAFRYEYAFMQKPEWVGSSVREHREISDTYFDEGVEPTIKLLDKHWQFSMQALLEKFETKEE